MLVIGFDAHLYTEDIKSSLNLSGKSPEEAATFSIHK